MSQVKAVFSGNIVAEPERKNVGGSDLLVFPVYVNDQKKNADTGDYEDTGHVTKIRVQLWREAAAGDWRKGDIVEVTASIYEREYDKNDGTKGRSLETKFVDDVTLKWRRDDSAPAAASGSGFADAPVPAGFGGAGF